MSTSLFINTNKTMKVLVATDKPFAKIAVDGIRKEIEAAGYELALLEKYGEKAKLLEAVKDADAIIIRSDVIDAEVLDAAKELKIVVRAGEDKWIFPYQENADVMFNSALLFEFAVLRLHAEPILMGVPRNCPEYCEAYRLLKFIKYFVPVQDKEIPPTSLLREFLGGSSFKY